MAKMDRRLDLRGFLALLATNQGLMDLYTSDPDAAFDQCGLSKTDRNLLRSKNAEKIYNHVGGRGKYTNAGFMVVQNFWPEAKKKASRSDGEKSDLEKDSEENS